MKYNYRFNRPESDCRCPSCGFVYGSPICGEVVDAQSGFCEKCCSDDNQYKPENVFLISCDDYLDDEDF